MIKKTLIGLVFLIGLTLSCNKQDKSLVANAKVIEFTSEDCMCCWGWTIVYLCDTIKSSSLIIGDAIGYNLDSPVWVYIELGNMLEECSSQGFDNPELSRDYYNIIKIEKVN